MPQSPKARPGKWGSLGWSPDDKEIQSWMWNDELMGTFVAAVINGGDAVMISTTRDGSACRVIIFEGQEKHSMYFGSVAELEGFLTTAIEAHRKYSS